MNRKLVFTLLILILLATACGGGGGNKLTYKAEGSASRARVEYKDAQGETQTESVTLPWETTLDVGNDFGFKLNVYNEGQDGTVTCAVWINEREIGDTTSDSSVGCVGSFQGDGDSATWSFSSYRDTGAKETDPEPTKEPAETATVPAAPVPTLAPITAFERYEHDRDCTDYDPELKLRAFAVLYPRGAVIEDCEENPDNYVAFSLDPGGDIEDPALVFALGRFNSTPPGPTAYTSNGARLMGILTTQIESQYGAEKIAGDPIVYQDVTLFYGDFVSEIKGTRHLVRMAAIPNFDHGHGLLFFMMQKIGDDHEPVLPEFDRVSRELIASIEFPTTEPTVGSITFATGVDSNDEPLDPATTFPAGVLEVFAVFEYDNILPSTEFGYAWYLDGEQVLTGINTWEDELSGKTWISVNHPTGLSGGDYELQISLNGKLAQTGNFVVESAPEAEMDATAWFDKGLEHSERGEHQEALAAFDSALELDPDYASAYNSRAITYANLGDLERAMADVNQAVELDPDYVDAYNTRGEVYRLQGDHQRAVADYDQAIALDPDYALPYYNRARSLRALGDADSAMADLNQSIALDPDYVHAYFQRGVTYYMLDELDLALADYDQTVALDPTYAVAYLNRGVIYYLKGELGPAIADFSQAIELRPDYDQAYLNRGLSYADQGDTESAIADFRVVLEVSNNPDLRQQAEDELETLGESP
ncbi:MAG: tetratricopeptide repeat protein [Anaerolineae bacterium]|jgi:tetratricopeptide (TPR) repeat protein